MKYDAENRRWVPMMGEGRCDSVPKAMEVPLAACPVFSLAGGGVPRRSVVQVEKDVFGHRVRFTLVLKGIDPRVELFRMEEVTIT